MYKYSNVRENLIKAHSLPTLSYAIHHFYFCFKSHYRFIALPSFKISYETQFSENHDFNQFPRRVEIKAIVFSHSAIGDSNVARVSYQVDSHISLSASNKTPITYQMNDWVYAKTQSTLFSWIPSSFEIFENLLWTFPSKARNCEQIQWSWAELDWASPLTKVIDSFE